MTKEILKIPAAMNVFRTQTVMGTLSLFDNCIKFKASGVLENTEVKDIFYLDEIQNVKHGISLMPFRITIQEKDGENYIFDQVNKQQAKQFVEAYKNLTR